MVPASNKETWFRHLNVDLPNGDGVGVTVPWEWPNAFAGISSADALRVQTAIDGKNYRANVRAKSNWVGKVIGEMLGIDTGTKHGKAHVCEIIDTWLRKGVLIEKDVRDPRQGREVPCVFVGKWMDGRHETTEERVRRSEDD
jgi:hypothetical protein